MFATGNECMITRNFRRRGVLREGLDAVLDKDRLADLMLSSQRILASDRRLEYPRRT